MLIGFDVASDKSSERIQNIVDSSPEADFYYTDGYFGYMDFFPGRHIRNVRDKKDTHNVESINADLRHYIPVLARKADAFPEKWKHFMLLWLYSLMLIIASACLNINTVNVRKLVKSFSLSLIFFNNAIVRSFFLKPLDNFCKVCYNKFVLCVAYG